MIQIIFLAPVVLNGSVAQSCRVTLLPRRALASAARPQLLAHWCCSMLWPHPRAHGVYVVVPIPSEFFPFHGRKGLQPAHRVCTPSWLHDGPLPLRTADTVTIPQLPPDRRTKPRDKALEPVPSNQT